MYKRACIVALPLLVLSACFYATTLVTAEEWQLFVTGLRSDSYEHIYEHAAHTPLKQKSIIAIVRKVDNTSSLRLRRVAAVLLSRLEINADNESEVIRMLHLNDEELQICAALRAIVYWSRISNELKRTVREIIDRDEVLRAAATLREEDCDQLEITALDSSPLVRAAVARRIEKIMVLGGGREAAVRPVLLRLMADQDRLVRSTAATALCHSSLPLQEFVPLVESMALDVRRQVLLDEIFLPDVKEDVRELYQPEYYRTHIAAQSSAGLCILQTAPFLGPPPGFELVDFAIEPRLIGERACSLLLIRNGESGKAFLERLKKAPDPRGERKRIFK